MTTAQQETITTLFCDVLETSAFMFGDLIDREDLPDSIDCYTIGSINFSGDSSGQLHLATTRELAHDLAMNILGVDSEMIDTQAANDALGELLNVTLGQLLTTIESKSAVFNLSPPNISQTTDPKDWQAHLNNPKSIYFDIDDQPLILVYEHY